MERYRMSDGTVVDTRNATRSWEEQRDFDGSNHVGRWSRAQVVWATLYRSRRGRYYIVTVSSWNGHHAWAEWVSREEAARFLLVNEEEIPEELAEAAEEVSE